MDAIVGPELSLAFQPDTATADVSDRPVLVLLCGWATVEQPWFMSSLVNLSVSCVWSCSVKPSNLQFDGSVTLPFSISVYVPVGTLPRVSNIVAVDGSCRTGGVEASSASAMATVIVADYNVIRVWYDGEKSHIPRGETRDVEVSIHSRANVDVQVSFELIDVPDGVQVKLPEAAVCGAPSRTTRVNVSISVPEDASDMPQRVKLVAHVRDLAGQDIEDVEFDIGFSIVSGFSLPRGWDAPAVIVLVAAIACAASVLVLRHRRRGRLRAERVDNATDGIRDVGTTSSQTSTND